MVLAPTGVAALHVGGVTIHSFFGFAPRLLNPEDIRVEKNHKLLKAIDTIIIDEISMVRAEILDHIDLALRLSRRSDRPFGGVQMIFFGDLFQLPPVVASPFEKHYFATEYQSPYFFSARVFNDNFIPETFELQIQYRQEERRFINLLDAIRSRDVDYDTLSELNSRVVEIKETAGYITLTARNNVARKINQAELEDIATRSYRYTADIKGNFKEQYFPTSPILQLKVGAQVMFLKNDPHKRYVNGTVGRIISLSNDEIKVAVTKSQQEKTIVVEKSEWEILRYQQDLHGGEIRAKTVGTFTQYPLRLAWAITIHKSQGKTFDKVIIDLGQGAFEHGQTYVALSRCRTLEGIILRRPIRYADILVDERIVDFYQRLNW